MDSYRRQMAIFYEFLDIGDYITCEELAKKFCISKKTLHNDIKTLNDLFRNNNIELIMKRGRGLFLKCNCPENLNKLKEMIAYRFIDTNDILNSKSTRMIKILSLFLNRKGYIKINELSDALNVSPRSVTIILNELRKFLKKYQLTLKNRPHYGLCIQGNELKILQCYTDTICFNTDNIGDQFLFMDSFSGFHLEDERKEELMKICCSSFQKYNLDLELIEIRKLVVLILVLDLRAKQGKNVTFSKEQLAILQEIVIFPWFDSFIEKLANFGYHFVSKTDYYVLFLYIYIHLDFNYLSNQKMIPSHIMGEVFQAESDICEVLGEHRLLNSRNEESFRKMIFPFIIHAILFERFDFIEHDANKIIKQAMCNSPLTISITDLIFSVLQERMPNLVVGEMLYYRMALSVYSWICETDNNRRNNLALVVPFSKEFGESLRNRILDRFRANIKKLDILTLNDLLNTDLIHYDYLLTLEHLNEKMTNGVPQLMIDFYFVSKDVQNFYELIVIPSRIARRAFGKLRKGDYITNFNYQGLEQFLMDFREMVEHFSIYRDVVNFHPEAKNINHFTLNLIFFTASNKECFSKLIFLNHIDQIDGTRFNRIFIHVIDLNSDMIKFKVTEKVIRNCTSISDTEEVILQNSIDFYEYYINRNEVRL